MVSASTSSTASPATPGAVADLTPPAPLAVPNDILSMLRSAVSDGVKEARDFQKSHPVSERWLIAGFALTKVGWPPRSDEKDLARLHELAKGRTPEQNASAIWWSDHGLGDSWTEQLKQYRAKAGPTQAKAAEKLLNDTLQIVNQATQISKASNARTRPFIVDPSLGLIVEKPGNNPSFPSGHTSAAFAAALVLSYLMPERQREFMSMAEQAAFARVYSGVHFPTDIEAGAKLATTIAAYMVNIAPQAYGLSPDRIGASKSAKSAQAA